MSQLTRRTFLRNSAILGTAAAFSARSWAQVAGANSDLRVAVIGLNGRGNSHLASLAAIKGVRVVALCDPDTAVLERAKVGRKGKDGKAGLSFPDAKLFTDLRELFQMSDLDAVT